MRDVQKLRDLLERVEAASGSDWELSRDFSIFAGTRARDPQTNEAMTGEGPAQYKYVDYTGSLDASIALVERMLPGWDWLVNRSDLGGEYSAVVEHWDGDEHGGNRPTAPLAILSALLCALISQAEGEGQHG